MSISMVCTLIDDHTCHHSGQNLLWTHLAAPCESTTFWPLRWRISLPIKVQTVLNHIRFVKYILSKGLSGIYQDNHAGNIAIKEVTNMVSHNCCSFYEQKIPVHLKWSLTCSSLTENGRFPNQIKEIWH